MYEIEKTYSENPFVDEMIYYSKILALNSVVKDEEEALKNETPESLKAGELYIQCVEGRAKYEMFESFPEEILEKYIVVKSNIDMMAENEGAFSAYMNSLGLAERTELLKNLSKLANTIYIDHYDIMKNYIDTIGPNWLEENKELYNKCMAGIATYKDLFDLMPKYTTKRILNQYVNNYDNDDIDYLSSSLSNFEEYVLKRTDGMEEELANINKAMSSCFASHYEIIIDRGYLKKTTENNWFEYMHFPTVYDRCIKGTATYDYLYEFFPKDDLRESLSLLTNVDQTTLDYLVLSLDNLNAYLKTYTDNALLKSDIVRINSDMMDKYIANYSVTLNFSIYNRAKDDLTDFMEMRNYLPTETVKIVLNNFIEEITNINTYAQNKTMLDSYLNSLTKTEAENIKQSITKEMIPYYINNYKELNNYYRIIMGLPPIGNNGIYEDTLLHSYNAETDSYIKFGDELIKLIPDGIYPDIHWTKSQIYEFDAYDISILKEYGVFDKFLELVGSNYNSKRYKYLKYLGDNALDIYTCRKALNFQLISTPIIDNVSIKNKFIDKFTVNRDYIIRTIYSDAYKFQSDYYNKFIIIFMLINTIMDVLADVPKLIIDREIFDSRSIKYLFESFGIPYYSEIPVKYQQAMLKNLNTLIKYKSSTKNMIDICSLFGFEDIKVFGYYMLKDRLVDTNTGEYLFSDNGKASYDLDDLYIIHPVGPYKDSNNIRYIKLVDYSEYNKEKYTHTIHVKNEDGTITTKDIINSDVNCYIRDDKTNKFIHISKTDYYTKIKDNIQATDVKFVKVPIDDTLTEYKKDADYITDYDTITLEDDTWDGGLLHEKVKQDILDYEFNAVLTKYISVETVTEMTELAFQVSYFYNMLFDNLYSEESLTVEIPFIKMNHQFKFIDVVCYLFALMYLYNGIEDRIMYSPTQILYVKGYNFDTDLNKILADPNFFSQTKDPMEQENIFNINERIAEDGYDYREAFEDYRIKSFNLDVDMDELDKWLSQYRLSLDDFIVDDTLTTFDRIITLRDFYSLNNSYYQKDLFKNNLVPVAHNQEIKHAFDCLLLEKINISDINKVIHQYVIENGSYGIIVDDTNNEVFILNNTRYGLKNHKENTALYNKFIKDSSKLIMYDYYTLDPETGEYVLLLDDFEGNAVYIKDNHGDYVLSSDEYYLKNEDNTYSLITDDIYFIEEILESDEHGNPTLTRKLLNVGDWFEPEKDKDGNYILHPENDYIKVWKNDEFFYILYTDISKYSSGKVPEEYLFVNKDDGTFIPLLDTDFYELNPDGSYSYIEDDCYIESELPTEYFDPNIPDKYYQKLNDYYKENNYIIDESMHYVKDYNGNYIPVNQLLSPTNCYIKKNNLYYTVDTYYVDYVNYAEPLNVEYMYLLNEENDYIHYNYSLIDTINVLESNNTYINESSGQYILVLINNTNYDITKEMIVVLNNAVEAKSYTEIDTSEIYDPEKLDGVWDENDWHYSDPSYDPDSGIGMNGENKWYYKKPGSDNTPKEEQEINYSPVPSGFYLEASSYLGNIDLVEGEKYYISMDVETNFDGKIKIACDADKSNKDITSRMYDVYAGEKFHVSQVFTCNNIVRPRIVFFIYNYDEFPINRGDYIVVKNIRIVKSHSDNYIPQDIPSYDKLQEIYRTNEAIYKYLVTLMQECSDHEMYQIYQKLYDSLMVSKYNKEMFKLSEDTYAETYTEFLQTRDSVLYERLTYFKSLDTESMHKAVADNIIEVTYAIDDCVDTYSYGYLYSYFPAVSASYIQQYISKIIDFFKSWKVHLLGINTIYRFDDGLENRVKILEDQQFKNTIHQETTVFLNHSIKINPMDDLDPSGINYGTKYPDIISYEYGDIQDKFSHSYEESYNVIHGLKMISRTSNSIRYRDNEVDLILNNDDIHAYTDNEGQLNIVNSDGFSISMPNDLIFDNDEDEQSFFSGQRITEVNVETFSTINSTNNKPIINKNNNFSSFMSSEEESQAVKDMISNLNTDNSIIKEDVESAKESNKLLEYLNTYYVKIEGDSVFKELNNTQVQAVKDMISTLNTDNSIIKEDEELATESNRLVEYLDTYYVKKEE